MRQRYGSDFLRRLFAATREAQRFVRALIDREGIACDLISCRSFNGVYSTADDALLDDEWNAIRDADEGVRLLRGGEVPSDAKPFEAAIVFEDEARFHVRKFLMGLAGTLTPRVSVFEETEIQSLTVSNDRVSLAFSGAAVRAPIVILTAGGPAALCSELSGLASTRLTFALAAHFDAGVPFADHLFWDCDEPYQYFRRLDGSTAIIGGADRDADAASPAPDPHGALREFAARRLGGDFSVTHQWSGSLFETEDGLPYVAPHPHYGGRVIVATGFSGNGMVMGALGGRLAANLALGREDGTAPLFQFARTGATIPAPASPAAATSVRVTNPPAGTVTCLKAGDHDIALFNVEGRSHAIDDKCTHAGGRLCKGAVSGTIVTCPLHRSKFDVRDGSVVAGPARSPVATYKTHVQGNDVEIRVAK